MIRSEKTAWVAIVALELTYIVIGRLVVSAYGTYSLQSELIGTPARVALIAAYWLLFRELLTSKKLAVRDVAHPAFLLPTLAFLSVPLLVGDLSYMDAYTRSLYAATSVIVALREEITFRAVIQNLLAKRLPAWGAICATSLLFTLWHVGIVPVFYFAYAQVAIASLLLGIVYAKTRNLWLVVWLHTLYDALWSLTPIVDGRIMDPAYGTVLLCIALAGIAWWGWDTVRPART